MTKDFILICKNRKGTFASRMNERSTEWRQFKAKRYTEEGAVRAFQTLSKKHRGMDWGIFQVSIDQAVLLEEKEDARAAS